LPKPRPVHVVILAAGRGSRLGRYGDHTPKWLLDIGGRTISDLHLEAVERAGDRGAVASVRVVVGHAAESVAAALAARPGEVHVVGNPEYAELNNWWSLLLALRELPEDGPVAVLNADLVAPPAHLAAFLEAAAAGDADGLLCVDLARRLTDESMKVARGADGALRHIGKVGVPDAEGEYIGLLMARGPVLRALRETLEGFVGRPDAAQEWYEGAVGRTAAAGRRWEVWPLPGGDWVEIDDADDLDIAVSLMSDRP
jgi:choline kinase